MNTSEAPAARLARPAAWTVAVAATLTMSVSYVDRQSLAALAPTVIDELRLSRYQYGWLQSAFSIAYLVGAPLAGRWIDRTGARVGLPLAVVVWSLVAASHAWAAGFVALFALRIALGLAEAPSFPGAVQAVQRVLGPRDRSAGFGVLFTGSSIGAAVAPPLAVALAARYGWRGAFVGVAAAGLAWIPLWLAVSGRAGARAALDRAPAVPAPSARAREAHALVEIARLVRDPSVARAVLAVIATAPTVAFLLLWSAKYLADAHRVPQRDVGHYLWLPPLLFDAGAVGFGLLASRAERAHSDAPHRALFAAAVVLTLAVGAVPLAPSPWSATAVMAVAMAGGGACFALLTGDMMSRVREDRVSSAGGLATAAQSLAYIIANPLFGAVAERRHNYGAVLAGLAVWALPGCLAWLLWTPPPRRVTAA